MSWTWRYENRDGETLPPEVLPELGEVASSPSFPTQADAESWVGEVWRDLAARGVDQVSLFEDGRLVYGPMSLHPA
ncbi:MAG TPA: hypothetical protein VMI11_12375 [Actinomycetes bacterium]|nr:hypothetical protein [Actinomycetes bacterium]